MTEAQPATFLGKALHNLPQKIGAVLAATLLWFVATQDRRAVVTRSLELPLVVVGTDKDRVVRDLPKNVRVALEGPRATLEEVQEDAFEASIDAATLEEGFFSKEVVVSHPDTVRVRRVEPRQVSGTLDVIATRSVGVRVANLDAGGPATTTTPKSVQAKGPKANLDVVGMALAVSKTPQAGQEETVELIAVNAQGQPVPEVTLSPRAVVVRLAFGSKRLPLELVLPAGYSAQNLRFVPNSVLVSGNTDALVALTRVVARLPNAQAGRINAVVQLELPKGVNTTETVRLTADVKR